ncbi:MAG TPA: glycosyltransferase family 4 protein, partial [Gemmatimonadaceae bacterium]|nr:glycosyltransferase family 4 protein [Gemmatimonadaceae bacterium]
MKVLHVPYTWSPDPVGGTEIYVRELVRELAGLGIAGSVAAPRAGPAPARATIDGIEVHRYGSSSRTHDVRELYGVGVPGAPAELSAIIDAESPDAVHLHGYAPAIGGAVAREVARRGIPLVATYHTPAVSCQRGTLLRFGDAVCDGRLFVGRCAACVIQQHGAPRPVAEALARLPAAIGRAVAGDRSGPWLALRMRELMALHHDDVEQWLGAADRVVAVAKWVRDLLLRLDVAEEKIVLSRQGIARSFAASRTPRPDRPSPIRA